MPATQITIGTASGLEDGTATVTVSFEIIITAGNQLEMPQFAP